MRHGGVCDSCTCTRERTRVHTKPRTHGTARTRRRATFTR